MRRSGTALALVGLLLLTLFLGVPSLADAQDQAPPPTVEPAPNMIPRPNSGRPPADSGDLGGSLQLLVLGLLVVAVAGGVLSLVRQSRRARSGMPSP